MLISVYNLLLRFSETYGITKQFILLQGCKITQDPCIANIHSKGRGETNPYTSSPSHKNYSDGLVMYVGGLQVTCTSFHRFVKRKTAEVLLLFLTVYIGFSMRTSILCFELFELTMSTFVILEYCINTSLSMMTLDVIQPVVLSILNFP